MQKKDYKISKSRYAHKKTLGILTRKQAERTFDTIFKKIIEKMLFEHFNATPIEKRKYFNVPPKNSEEQKIADMRPQVLVDIYAIIDDIASKPQNYWYKSELYEYLKEFASWREKEIQKIFVNGKLRCLKLFDAKNPSEFIYNYFEDINDCPIESVIERSVDRLTIIKLQMIRSGKLKNLER